MRQQVNDDRIRARHLLYLSQEIVKLKLRIEDDIARTQSNSTHLWFDDISLIELMSRINYEFEGEKDSRQVRRERTHADRPANRSLRL